MSSDEGDTPVKLYNPLERNRKRQHFVSIDSSSSEEDESSVYEESPLVPKRRRSLRSSRRSSMSPSVAARTDGDDEGEEKVETLEDLMTDAEREAARQSELQIEREIAQRIAQDEVLNKTREIMNKISSAQRQRNHDSGLTEVISLDSDDDDDDDDFQIISQPVKPGAAKGASRLESSRQSYQQAPADKGERIVLQIRANGERTDEVPIHMNEPFDVLYKNFCDLLGLPRTAVKMSLDGDALPVSSTPSALDLESGDLIDAKVDFSQQNTADIKTFVRLKLIVQGKRPEIFKIDVNSTLEKLHSGFCKKHNIVFSEDVVLSALGVTLRLNQTIESYGLRDDDEIQVEIENVVDPSAIALQLRFSDGTTETHHVIP
uniref:Rad60/SUMO-like domain-containing protein n=1 Tax=Globisporangium ultimum (strain ATCC 200006 / CBS 805.95 / DAOM BR144) TaxID=431595 RepID=K3WMT6_GLOUD